MTSAILLGTLGLSTFAGLQQAPPPGAVHGRVLSARTGTPLEGAAVEVRRRGAFRFLITDGDGTYRANGLAPGRAVVIARALDHAPLVTGVDVPAGGDVSLDFRLEVRPVLMPSLFAEIDARRLEPPSLVRGGFRPEGETELRALDSSPGAAEMGLADGAPPDPGDPSSLLYVRGAASDLKLVLIDGAPVYAPFHLSGLLDAFPDGVLDRASLYIGGTPARYDGGLSYVLDLELREGDPDGFRTAGAVDLLGATARFEGPIGSSARALVSGRALHGAGYPVVTGDSDLPYGYGDVLGRIDADVAGGHLSMTGFWNRESVDLDLGKLEETGVAETAFWGNASGSVRYRRPLGGGTLTVSTAYGRFTTRLPVPLDESGSAEAFGSARGQTSRSRTEAFYESGGDAVRWAAGGGFDTHETILDQSTLSGDTTAHGLARAHVGAAWGEAIWAIVPEIEIRAGVRADYFEPASTARLAPRATATWHVTESADLRVSAGRFYQLVRGPESILSGDLTGPTLGPRPVLDSPVPGEPPPALGVAGASHLVVGIENELENGVDLGIEGYFKSFDDLPGTRDLYSSGADLWVQAKEGPVRGWVGYSLAWVWADDPGDESRFVGRQLLSGGLSTNLSGFDLGLRLAYGAGLPFTSVRGAGGPQADGGAGPEEEEEEPPAPALSGALDDSYLRIDAEVARRWLATVAGSSVEIAPYVRLLNALDRRDALFYQAGPDGPTRPAPLSSVPLIAVLGVAWSF